jgi:hypothetical protein
MYFLNCALFIAFFFLVYKILNTNREIK